MRSYNKTELPETIILKDEAYIIDLEATNLFRESKSSGLLKFEMQQQNKKYVRVNVLAKKLRIRPDLTVKPYQPITFIFTTKIKPDGNQAKPNKSITFLPNQGVLSK